MRLLTLLGWRGAKFQRNLQTKNLSEIRMMIPRGGRMLALSGVANRGLKSRDFVKNDFVDVPWQGGCGRCGLPPQIILRIPARFS